MKWKNTLIVLMTLIFFSSCEGFRFVVSLNPFYKAKQEKVVPEIEGRWKVIDTKAIDSNPEKSNVWSEFDSTAIWQITRSFRKEVKKDINKNDSTFFVAENYYLLELKYPDTDSLIFNLKMVFFNIDNVMYADLSAPDGPLFNKSILLSNQKINVHSVARVQLKTHSVVFTWLDAECVKEMIENKRVRLHCNAINELLLTGDSDELTRMLRLYGAQKRFIDWDKLGGTLTLNKQI